MRNDLSVTTLNSIASSLSLFLSPTPFFSPNHPLFISINIIIIITIKYLIKLIFFRSSKCTRAADVLHGVYVHNVCRVLCAVCFIASYVHESNQNKKNTHTQYRFHYYHYIYISSPYFIYYFYAECSGKFKSIALFSSFVIRTRAQVFIFKTLLAHSYPHEYILYTIHNIIICMNIIFSEHE